jgi:hypothetical protein
MGLFRADPNQTPSQKRGATWLWGAMGVICLGGSIYLALTGSWGWLLLGVPSGALMLRRADTLSREVDSFPST